MAQRVQSQSDKAAEITAEVQTPVQQVEGEQASGSTQSDGEQKAQAQVPAVQPQTFHLPDTITVNGQKISTKPWGENKRENASKIKTHQDKIKAHGIELDGMILENAVQTVVHAKMYGDTSLMVRLLQVLPRGYRLEGVKAWLREAKFPIKVETDKVKAGGIGKITMREGWQKEEAWEGLAKARPVSEFLAGAKAERNTVNGPTDSRKKFGPDNVRAVLGAGKGGMLSQLFNAQKNGGNPSKEDSSTFKGVEGDPKILELAICYALNRFNFAMANPAEARQFMDEITKANRDVQAEAEAARELTRKRAENEIAAKAGEPLPHPELQDNQPSSEVSQDQVADLQREDVTETAVA